MCSIMQDMLRFQAKWSVTVKHCCYGDSKSTTGQTTLNSQLKVISLLQSWCMEASPEQKGKT